MPQIKLTTRDGKQTSIPYRTGISLMQALSEGGVAELLALCGGVCNCATCHVYVGGKVVDQLGPVSEDEDFLLADSPNRKGNSRLSCQVLLTESLEGLEVTIAPED